jgi:hypothetical protein
LAVMMRLVFIGLLSLSCSRWHNDANRLKLVCGPDVDPQTHTYVQVDASEPEDMDAILLNNGQWQTLAVSSYGCLEIPRSLQGRAEIAIRDRKSIQGRLLVLERDLKTSLVSTHLTAEPSLSPEQIRMFCPSDPFVTPRRIALNRVTQPTRLLSKPLLHAELYNDQGQRVQEFPLNDADSSLHLDASLGEGRYQLKLISRDAFERNTPAFESSCQIQLDRTAPVIRSSLSQEAFYDQNRNIRQLAPEAQVTFPIEDASEAVPAVCVKPHPAVCSEEDFLPLRSIRAPGKGLWDVQAYATDKAGLRSELLRETFAVYQQSQVNNLQTLLSNVKFNLLLDQQPAALSTMQETMKVRELLELEGERQAIQWSYVDTFWKLDQQLKLIRSIDIKSPIRSLTGSAWTDDFLVQGEAGAGLLFRQDQPSTAVERSSHADFAENGALWALGADRVLRLYEKQELIRSFTTDMNGMASVAAGQGAAKAVVWTDQGQETLVRVYDRNAAEDAPIFKVNLPKTLFLRGKYSFFAQDRYLIGRNNNQLLIWDLQNAFAQRSYTVPEGCIVQDFAVRDDRQIYIVSQRQRTPTTGTIPPEKSFCELQRVDLNDESLNTTLNARLPNVTNPSSLTLSSNPGQNFLVLGRTLGSHLHLLDLNKTDSNPIFKLDDGENALRVTSLSDDKPMFFVATGKRVLLLQPTYFSTPAVYFSGANLGSCLPQTRAERFLCYQQDQSILNIYSSELDRALQPTLFRSFSQYQSPDGTAQYLTASLLAKPLHAFFDQETRSLQLQDENKTVRAEATFGSTASALSLHESGRLAVGLQNGEIAVLAEGAGLVLYSEDIENGPIVDLHMSADAVYALRKRVAGGFQLETLRYQSGGLTRENVLNLPAGPTYSHLLFSETTGRGVVYQKDRGPVTQEAVVFQQDGSEQGLVPMSMCAVNESRNRRGFHFVRDRAIHFYDFSSAREELITANINFNACAFLEGEQLYALADYGSSLYAVASATKVAGGITFGLGPQGSIIVATSNNELKVLSADGRTTYVNMNFKMSTQVERILGDPDQADIVIQYRQDSLGQGIKRMSTSLDAIDEHLRRWMRP